MPRSRWVVVRAFHVFTSQCHSQCGLSLFFRSTGVCRDRFTCSGWALSRATYHVVVRWTYAVRYRLFQFWACAWRCRRQSTDVVRCDAVGKVPRVVLRRCRFGLADSVGEAHVLSCSDGTQLESTTWAARNDFDRASCVVRRQSRTFPRRCGVWRPWVDADVVHTALDTCADGWHAVRRRTEVYRLAGHRCNVVARSPTRASGCRIPKLTAELWTRVAKKKEPSPEGRFFRRETRQP